MALFEIVWSAVAFAYLVHALEPFEPPAGPKGPLIPIKANGRDIRVPPGFADIVSDISKFATKFEVALKKAVPELKSDSGTLWTARLVRGKKPGLEKALQGMDGLRRDHSALLDRAIEAYDRGKEIGEDLKKCRKEQWVKMREVQELMQVYWPTSSSWTLV